MTQNPLFTLKYNIMPFCLIFKLKITLRKKTQKKVLNTLFTLKKSILKPGFFFIFILMCFFKRELW